MRLFSEHERTLIQEYFGLPLEQINIDIFKSKHKELRKKFHPDKFQSTENTLIIEVFENKFKEIEALCEKIEIYFNSKNNTNKLEGSEIINLGDAQYAIDGLRLDIVSHDKDLPYILFGTHYRWLVRGEKFKIPKTKTASIRIEANYMGRSVGFTESIKLFLSFSIEDSTEDIVEWLYNKINDRASYLLIEKEKIPIDFYEILKRIRKISYLQLGPNND
jgi:hypothetical protein